MHPSPDHHRSPGGGAGDRSEPTPPARGSTRERRPYPNAPTTTRPSYARPGPRRHHHAVPTVRTPPPPIPSTVWICPPDPRRRVRAPGLDIWAGETLAAVLAAFTAPLDRVGVLAWPDPTEHAPTPPRPAGAPTRPATAEEARDRPGPASALDVISAAGRVPILLDLHQDAGTAATPAPGRARRRLGPDCRAVR